MQAFTSGKMTIKGDMALAQKVVRVGARARVRSPLLLNLTVNPNSNPNPDLP